MNFGESSSNHIDIEIWLPWEGPNLAPAHVKWGFDFICFIPQKYVSRVDLYTFKQDETHICKNKSKADKINPIQSKLWNYVME